MLRRSPTDEGGRLTEARAIRGRLGEKAALEPTLEKKPGGSMRDRSLEAARGSDAGYRLWPGLNCRVGGSLSPERGQNKPKSKRLGPLLLTKPLTASHSDPD